MSTMSPAAPTRDPAPPSKPPAHHKSRNPLARYTRWLHTQWPAGTVEKLPEANPDGSTRVPGLYIVGDLTGIPLLKFSADTGAKAVQTILKDPNYQKATADLDLVIIGAGVSGMAAALEARKNGLKFEILESAEPFNTIVNFPKAKPIYTYPTDMTPAGDLQFRAQIKEDLVDEMRAQTKGITPTRARVDKVTRAGDHLDVQLTTDNGPRTISAKAVIVAIGRSGNYRKLNVPGEDSGKVFNRLHDPKEYAGKHCLVVGAGDSALETAIALAQSGALVALSHRTPEISRAKPDNVEKLTRLMADPMADVQVEKPKSERTSTATGGYMGDYRKPGQIVTYPASKVREIRDDAVLLADQSGKDVTLKNDVVFTMIGREAPLDFFRRSGVPIRGEWTPARIATLVLALAVFIFVYHWKKGGVHIADVTPFKQIQSIGNVWADKGLFPYNVPAAWAALGGAFARPTNPLGTLKVSLGEPGFYYSLAYCLCVVGFGARRIKRKPTPYIKLQTLSLMVFQVIPLFLLPYLVLPWLGHNGAFDSGVLKTIADALFPLANYGHGREYWRAFGLVLAWPLFFWNVFTSEPMWTWLAISLVQTFVIIPTIIYFWGKGAYCGWICSCGALAETLGDAHRHKMPHGPGWNRLNMVGQVFLAFAFVLLFLRVLAWATPTPATAVVKEVRAGDASSHLTLNWNTGNTYTWPSGSVKFPDGAVKENLSKVPGILVAGDASGWVGQTVTLYKSPFERLHDRVAGFFDYLFHALPVFNYVWFVDLLWAGILGVGLYWHFSGRVWCRFACPLAALMHIYARFSRFRILADKKKCISCNVCTSVCHQGIDVMNFANKGLPMADPECVRCSACVQSCPTGVLSFGQIDRKTGKPLKTDPKWLEASPVHMVELHVNGKPHRAPQHA